MSYQVHRSGILSFNPSQVGYKLARENKLTIAREGFNPSQVGYKLDLREIIRALEARFNPSQVGYKQQLPERRACGIAEFQSLTGRLQTRADRLPEHLRGEFQSLTGRLQTALRPRMGCQRTTVSIPHR